MKYFLSVCIVNIWNSLPNLVVDVDTLNLFKTLKLIQTSCGVTEMLNLILQLFLL